MPGGADLLQLSRDSAAPHNLTGWLAGAIRAGIADGRLAPGTQLPPTRVLADDMRISRGVVVEVYQRLKDEGLISARPGAGTRVLGLSPAAAARGPAAGLADPAVPQLPRPWRSLAAIDLSPGVPDLSAFPRAAWLRAERAVLSRASAAELGYGDPAGSARLRAELASWLVRTRGLVARPEDIIVVAGVAQGMALLARVLCTAGVAAIAVEDPGSLGARDELRHWGLEPVPIPVDDWGVRVDHLNRSGARTALLTPAHQFPTGVVLAAERRRELLAWIEDGGLLIEDDYDAEYRYDRAPVPAFQASAPDHVAYCGSTSKSLAPGMRLGWLIPPRRLYADLVVAKHSSDLGSPALPQLILAELISSGELERHVRLVRKRLKVRRDALLEALAEQLPGVRVQGVPAGLHLMITFPDLGGELDDADLAGQIRRADVLVHPLSWHRVRPGPPGLIIGYAAHPPDQLREAVIRIAQALQTAIRNPRSSPTSPTTDR